MKILDKEFDVPAVLGFVITVITLIAITTIPTKKPSEASKVPA